MSDLTEPSRMDCLKTQNQFVNVAMFPGRAEYFCFGIAGRNILFKQEDSLVQAIQLHRFQNQIVCD